MNIKVAVVLLAVTAYTQAHKFSDELKAEIDKHEEACLKETGFTKEKLRKAEKKEEIDVEGVSKYLTCFFKKFDFINEDGKFNVDLIKEGVSKEFGDEVAKTFMEKCFDEKHKTEPANALYLAHCFDQHAGIEKSE